MPGYLQSNSPGDETAARSLPTNQPGSTVTPTNVCVTEGGTGNSFSHKQERRTSKEPSPFQVCTTISEATSVSPGEDEREKSNNSPKPLLPQEAEEYSDEKPAHKKSVRFGPPGRPPPPPPRPASHLYEEYCQKPKSLATQSYNEAEIEYQREDSFVGISDGECPGVDLMRKLQAPVAGQVIEGISKALVPYKCIYHLLHG